jgi:hypothetical protein
MCGREAQALFRSIVDANCRRVNDATYDAATQRIADQQLADHHRSGKSRFRRPAINASVHGPLLGRMDAKAINQRAGFYTQT